MAHTNRWKAKPIEARLFFYKNAGYSHDPKTETAQQGRARCARQLAEAERHALDNGCYWLWEPSDIDSSDFCDVTPAWQLWDCVMYGRESDHSLASLCAIDFGRAGSPAAADPYRRVVEAELSLEAFPEADR